MNLWKDIKNQPPHAPKVVYAVIETPKGSWNKYVYETSKETFCLGQVSPLCYPADYGIIPQALGDNGNPLNMLVLTHQPTFSGCLIKTKPIGIIKMRDDEGKDEKIIGVPVNDPSSEDIQDIKDLPKSLLEEITHFFREYAKNQNINTEIVGWENRKEAVRIIERSMDCYNDMLSIKSLFLLD
ncbi:inorganic diphosphatase [Methanobacterium formicicum]|uniref:inorganic diphosphatase n=1 Tax=Methanobacterium formicicum (strain DSM 3637 / PP1) TaxID=1204725 RepID=K2R0C9_METFP|nr:inorganic diphosphatase [Methanobacterium formicicum]EKF85988.1 inorganic pyrophosphatase [Methanobacterium formicicum DSM 3637]